MNEQASNEKKKRVKRSWSAAEKLAILEESFASSAGVSETARRHDISPGLLFHWRRLARAGKLAAGEGAGGFAIAQIVPPPGDEEGAEADCARTLHSRTPGAMEISIAGARIVVDSNVETEALARVLAALRRSAHPSSEIAR